MKIKRASIKMGRGFSNCISPLIMNKYSPIGPGMKLFGSFGSLGCKLHSI